MAANSSPDSLASLKGEFNVHSDEVAHKLWQTWRQQLRLTGERRLFVVAGTPSWTTTQASALCAALPSHLWLGEAPATHPQLPINKFNTVLGQEYDTLVFNAFSGLHPDALGAVAGTLTAGGVLILLCPPLESWAQYNDPDLLRYVAQPEQAANLKSRFLKRVSQLLAQDTQHISWTQGNNFPDLPKLSYLRPWQSYPDRHGCLNLQQRHSLAGLLQCARQRIPVILTADRGRGKSSLLGLAAARLLKHGLKVILTAPSPKAVHQVQAHCRESLPFYALDRLLDDAVSADILMIDEAAAIPVPLLLKLAGQYCCFFSSTLHGYEGTGLGFQLKFQPQLKLMFPNMRQLQLHTPARWSATDPLEPLLFKLLALNASAITLPAQGEHTIRWLSQAQLSDNEPLLQQVFGLLTLAHYQTSPSDLRHLLDAPELHLAVMFRQHTPIAVALVNTEGQSRHFPLTPALSLAIWRGERRPRGHLLAQSLAFHGGFYEACEFRYHRIMRIVVHPHCQQQGLGSQLLQWLAAQTQRPDSPLKGDFLGASFGASTELLAFWQTNHYRALRLGASRDKVSGLQAVMMLWPTSPAAARILPQWQRQFSANLQHTFQKATEQELSGLYRQLVLLPPHPQPRLDKQIAHDFSFYHRDLMADQAVLARFVANHESVIPLSNSQRQFIADLLQPDAQPSKVAKKHQISGYKSALAQLRKLMQGFFATKSKT